jgi:dTDP-4-dehydrorhamnose reductase
VLNNFDESSTYHYCSTPIVSWHQFAIAIIKAAKKYFPNESLLHEDEVKAVSTTDYPTLAARPHSPLFDCQKIATSYGIKQMDWMQGLHQSLSHLSLETRNE